MDAVTYALMQAIPTLQSIPEEPWSDITDVPAVTPTPDKVAVYTPLVLPDGRVVAVGQWSGAGPGGSAECWMWDPATPTVWTRKADMDVARMGAAMSVRPDGKVLVTGGVAGGSPLSSTSVFDPVANSWAAGPSLPKGRYEHAQTTLGNGDVLIVGGYEVTLDPSYGVVGSSLLSTGGTGAWTSKAALPGSLYLRPGALVTLSDGNGLLIGGINAYSEPITNVYRYNRSANTWTARASLPAVKTEFATAVAADGTVYTTVGRDLAGDALYNAERYDPIADVWTPASGYPRTAPTQQRVKMATLKDGRFFAIQKRLNNFSDGSANVRLYRPPQIVPMPGRGNLLAYIAAKE